MAMRDLIQMVHHTGISVKTGVSRSKSGSHRILTTFYRLLFVRLKVHQPEWSCISYRKVNDREDHSCDGVNGEQAKASYDEREPCDYILTIGINKLQRKQVMWKETHKIGTTELY